MRSQACAGGAARGTPQSTPPRASPALGHAQRWGRPDASPSAHGRGGPGSARGPGCQSPRARSPPVSYASAAAAARELDLPHRTPSCSPPRRAELFRGATETGKGDVTVCVRLRPGSVDAERSVELDERLAGSVRLVGGTRLDPNAEVTYQYDEVFGERATQEQVYSSAVEPICDAVLRGYNGAVIAYGQTGSGKTHTVLGNSHSKGVAAHAVNTIFIALAKRPCWGVEVSVLEIYNERVRDLLSPGAAPSHVEIHEVLSDHSGNLSFRCPDALQRRVETPEEALAALSEGMRRRETACTDQNHTSSRSHLIFTLSALQSDERLGATLRGRMHLVDLAGSERLKRSMAGAADAALRPRQGPGLLRSPQEQRREAGEINKSLSQLALVIARLTCPSSSSQMVPYRDSCLTRLLAESFGGSSKTCLIVTCSTDAASLQETRSSLEFGKRAKLVRNRAEINVEVIRAPTPVMQALVAQQLVQMQRKSEELLRERSHLLKDTEAAARRADEKDQLLREAVADAFKQQEQRAIDLHHVQAAVSELQQRRSREAAVAAAAQEASDKEVARLQAERQLLQGQLLEATTELSRLEREQRESESELREQLAERRRQAEQGSEQLEELRRQVQVMGIERASFQARLDAQAATLRNEWSQEIAAMRHENAAVVAALKDERDSLRRELREVRAAALLGGASPPRAGASAPGIRGAGSVAVPDGTPEATAAEAERLDLQRDRCLAAIEQEGAGLRRKWRAQIAGDGPGSPASSASPFAASLHSPVSAAALAAVGGGLIGGDGPGSPASPAPPFAGSPVSAAALAAVGGGRIGSDGSLASPARPFAGSPVSAAALAAVAGTLPESPSAGSPGAPRALAPELAEWPRSPGPPEPHLAGPAGPPLLGGGPSLAAVATPPVLHFASPPRSPGSAGSPSLAAAAIAASVFHKEAPAVGCEAGQRWACVGSEADTAGGTGGGSLR